MYRIADADRSEVGCTPVGSFRELVVQSSSELWDDLVYSDAGVYRNTKNNYLRGVTAGNDFTTVLQDYAPYWRLGLQKETGTQSFEIGGFGLAGKPDVDPVNPSAGTISLRDVGADASYQYIKGDHTFSAHATAIHENQSPNAGNGNVGTVLNTYRVDAIYHFKRQWGGGVQYFVTTGSSSSSLYSSQDPVMDYFGNNPLTRGYALEMDYLPIPQIKVLLRYTVFTDFNGAQYNYVPGRNAADNNYLYLNTQIMF